MTLRVRFAGHDAGGHGRIAHTRWQLWHVVRVIGMWWQYRAENEDTALNHQVICTLSSIVQYNCEI